MTEQQIVDISREALYLIIKCSAPMLIVSLIIGLVVSLFQTITSIQEQTLTFIPKIIAVFVTIMIAGSWLIENLTGYISELWGNFAFYCGF